MAAVKRFLTPQYLVVVLIALLIDQTKEFVSNQVSQSYELAVKWFGGLIMVTIIVGLANYLSVRSRDRLQVDDLEGVKVDPREGLIAIVSPGESPTAAETAIVHHMPRMKHCWLIVNQGSPGDPRSSSANFVEMERRLSTSSERKVSFYRREVSNQHDPEEVFKKVVAIIQEAIQCGLRPEQVIADYTGGTKSMSVGMALAAASDCRIDLEYILPHATRPDATAQRRAGGTPVRVYLSHGQ